MFKIDGLQSTADIDSRLAELEQEKNQLLALREQLQQPSPNTSDSPLYSPEQKIAIFRGLFRGRTDIFANRWQNKQGRSGYSVACNNEWALGICHKPRVKCQDCNHRQFTELNDQAIYRHLTGQQIVGLYPLMHDNTCYFLVADFDKGQWQHLAQMKSISHSTLTKLLTQIAPNSTLFKEQEVIEKRPPWEATAKAKPLILENSPKEVSVTLANHIYFDLSEIPSALAARLRRLASFSNPVFFKTQALRFLTHGIPRFISCARIDQGYLSIPRGCLYQSSLEMLVYSTHLSLQSVVASSLQGITMRDRSCASCTHGTCASMHIVLAPCLQDAGT